MGKSQFPTMLLHREWRSRTSSNNPTHENMCHSNSRYSHRSNGTPYPAGENRGSFLLEKVVRDNLCRTSRLRRYDIVSERPDSPLNFRGRLGRRVDEY